MNADDQAFDNPPLDDIFLQSHDNHSHETLDYIPDTQIKDADCQQEENANWPLLENCDPDGIHDIQVEPQDAAEALWGDIHCPGDLGAHARLDTNITDSDHPAHGNIAMGSQNGAESHPLLHMDGHSVADEILQLFGPAAVHFGETTGILDSSADIDLWHLQHGDTCAIVSQEFILESLTGHHYPEEQLVKEACEMGWYTPGGGTNEAFVGSLLELHGVHIERGHHFSIEDLKLQLESGNKVIVGVNGEDIWTPHDPSFLETVLTDLGFMPGQKENHAVDVVSIDQSDPAHPMVVLNDSGIEGGGGERVPLTTFEKAWGAGDNFMVHTVKV